MKGMFFSIVGWLLIALALIAIGYGVHNIDADAASYQSYNPTERTNILLERQCNTLDRIAVALEKIAK